MDTKDLGQITGQFMKLMMEFYYRFQEYPLSRGRFKPNSLSFHVLFRLYMEKTGRLSIHELAGRMQISKPQLIKLLNHLEDENLIVRERFKENRRMVYLSLSEGGHTYIRQMLEGMEQSLAESLSAKDEGKLSAFAEGVLKISEAMEP